MKNRSDTTLGVAKTFSQKPQPCRWADSTRMYQFVDVITPIAQAVLLSAKHDRLIAVFTAFLMTQRRAAPRTPRTPRPPPRPFGHGALWSAVYDGELADPTPGGGVGRASEDEHERQAEDEEF